MSPPTAALNRAAAHALVAALARGGVREAVVSPGSRNTPLVLALHTLAGAGALRLHVVLDERAAGFFALGLARASGRPALLCCTSGSAGAHYLPALTEASASRVGLVVLTADRPAELQGCGAPQTMDQTRMFGSFVKYYADLSEPSTGDVRWLAGVAARALYAAGGPDAGPVHLNVPFREPLWDAEEGPPPAPLAYAPRWVRGRPTVDEGVLDELAAWLDGAERGLIVVGPRELHALGAGPDPLPAALGALAARLGWPILADACSNLRYGPIPTLVAEALVRGPCAGLAPDRVLRLGGLPTSKALVQWLDRSGAESIGVDPGGRWTDPDHRVGLWVEADPAALCAALLPRVHPRAGWAARWTQAGAQAEALLAAACSEAPLWEGAVARAVVEAAPPGALLHVASSMPVRDLDALTPAGDRALRVACSRGVNGIDGTLSTALGEAQAWEGPTLALLGDLAFLHDLGAINLAAALPRPLTAVVVDNGGGNIFGFLPIGQHPTAFEPCFLTPQATQPAALARAAGAAVWEVTELDALRVALGEALGRPGGGLRLVVARVHRQHNLDAHRRAWAAVAHGVEAP